MDQKFNIVDLFFEAAVKYPDKTAIIEQNKAISFSEFSTQVKDTSAYFLSKGIGKGDRVMIFVPMSIDLYRIVLAVFNIGATAVFLDEWVSKQRMEVCCKVAQCKAFIGMFKARVFTLFSSELRKIPIKLGVGYSAVKGFPGKISLTEKSDTALITFTTGSTGSPKAAKRTHGFLLEQFNALLEKINPNEDDIDMPVLPIVLLINLGAGCTSVITDFKASKPDSMNPEKVFKQLIAYKVNRLVSSPFFVKQLAKYLILNKLAVPTLKKIFTGGAPVFPAEAILYDQAFPEAHVEIVYGSTEAEPISSITAKDLILENKTLLKQGLKVGVPYRKAEVKIIEIRNEAISCSSDAELQQLTPKAGKIGEIIVSGPHVLDAYFNNEAALKNNKIFIGNKCWHRTGDSGYLQEGALYLTGRCSTLIYTSETIIAPFIYEGFFQTIEGIEMGTIMKLNSDLVAILEPKKGANRQDLENKIQGIGIFDKIKFVTKLPRDQRHNSKIDYEALKKAVS